MINSLLMQAIASFSHCETVNIGTIENSRQHAQRLAETAEAKLSTQPKPLLSTLLCLSRIQGVCAMFAYIPEKDYMASVIIYIITCGWRGGRSIHGEIIGKFSIANNLKVQSA